MLSGTTGTRGFIGPHKHWTPGPVDKLRKAMLSIEFQAAIQTAVGTSQVAGCSVHLDKLDSRHTRATAADQR